jgi:hypothetical protein
MYIIENIYLAYMPLYYFIYLVIKNLKVIIDYYLFAIVNMIAELYNIFWNPIKSIYEPDETNTQNSFHGLNYNRENNYWIYSNDYESCIPKYTEDTTQNNDIQIWVTSDNIYVTSNNEPDLETIIDDIETGGHDTNCDIVNDCNDNNDNNDTLWSSYFMSAISTVNNFILGITENSTEKRKGE